VLAYLVVFSDGFFVVFKCEEGRALAISPDMVIDVEILGFDPLEELINIRERWIFVLEFFAFDLFKWLIMQLLTSKM